MNIPLQSFEQYIDETILKRGFQYFKKGLVNEPEEIGHGEYEAIVEGTDIYTVQITVKNDVITEYDCTCPYDMGPVCKHVVAVIFHLQQNELNLKVKTKKNPAVAKKTQKKKTVSEQVDGILEKLPPESVKEYLKEQCIKDSSFRQLFLARFAYLVIPESQALYAKQVRAILKSETNRSGYIEYSNARYVGKSVYELVQTAVSQVEMSNYHTAMYIACAVLEEMTEALQYVDDSNGDIGGCIDPALEVLYEIASKPIQDELRKELFDYCLNAFTRKIFKGWDWHFGMLDLATDLVKDTAEARQVHLKLDEIKPSGQSWDWDFKNAQLIRVKLIKKMEGDVKATFFLEQNISNPDFRKKVIETAIANKDFLKAIALAEEGIKLDQKESPGLADDWREYLLKVSVIQKDTEAILKYARHLFIRGNRVKKPYFDLIKKHVKPENWEIAITAIIKDISADNRWGGNPLIADIYIWEQQWEKLFGFVNSNISLHMLETYEKYLVNDYADEISDLYQLAIFKYMENNISRDHYRNACRYLRRMIKMGARVKASYVIQELRKLYPKRKALMEELLKV
jgi:hypothetical protein